MTKLILIGDTQEQQSSVISNFHRDLGSLMRIHGFQLRKRFDDLGHLVSLDWFSFARNRVLFSIQFDRPDLPPEKQIYPHIDRILSDLSIFQLVDIFLFDELGIIETYLEPIRQQIITVFSARVPVIATVEQKHLKSIRYLHALEDIKYESIRGQHPDRIYLKLIGELYDRW